MNNPVSESVEIVKQDFGTYKVVEYDYNMIEPYPWRVCNIIYLMGEFDNADQKLVGVVEERVLEKTLGRKYGKQEWAGTCYSIIDGKDGYIRQLGSPGKSIDAIIFWIESELRQALDLAFKPEKIS